MYPIEWDLNIVSVLSHEQIHNVSFACSKVEGLAMLSILPPSPPLPSPAFAGGKWMRQGKNFTDIGDREVKS